MGVIKTKRRKVTDPRKKKGREFQLDTLVTSDTRAKGAQIGPKGKQKNKPSKTWGHSQENEARKKKVLLTKKRD